MARAIWQKTIIDNTGAPSNNAQVTVTIQSGGAATIFSQQAGGSARANPFTTGADGIARFYAERGYYTVNVFKDGSSVSFPWNNLGDKNLFDDLGTAGLADLTTSANDVTAGRVLKVGDFGLGAPNVLLEGTNLNNILASGIYSKTSAMVNEPTSALGTMLVLNYAGVARLTQTYYTIGGEIFHRFSDGTFSDWFLISTALNNSLITSGTNSNGIFTRLPDGTQICGATITSSSSAEAFWTYPADFLSSPVVGLTITNSSATAISSALITSTSTTRVGFKTFNASAQTLNPTRLIAFGRWK